MTLDVKNDLGNIKAKAKFKDSGCTGEDQSFLSLQSVLQGVLEDIYIYVASEWRLVD